MITSITFLLSLGFAIQAQRDNKVIGQFEFTTNEKDFTKHKCKGDKVNTIAHNNPELKRRVKAVWFKPEGLKGLVTFKATVVKSREVFWSVSKVARF